MKRSLAVALLSVCAFAQGQDIDPSTDPNTPFITFLYEHVLGSPESPREPDAAGLQYWLQSMRQGADKTGVLAMFLTAPEYLNKSRGKDGAPGKDGIGFVWRGPFDATATYAVNDVVSSGGSAWIAIAANGPGELTPNANSAWQLMVSKGDDGFPGPQGPAGLPGPAGPIGPSGADGVGTLATPQPPYKGLVWWDGSRFQPVYLSPELAYDVTTHTLSGTVFAQIGSVDVPNIDPVRQSDGSYLLVGTTANIAVSPRVYRNGLRQKLNKDYMIAWPGNHPPMSIVPASPWDAGDSVVVDVNQ